MQELARKIDKVLDLVNFEKLFDGFMRTDFCIYDNGYLYYKDKIISFTAVSDAILTDTEGSIEVLAARAIKAMFLSHLSKNYNVHFPNYLLLLDYPQNYLNYDYMQYEKTLLLKSLHTKDLNEKLNYLRMFMNVRNNRQTIVEDFMKEEFKLETIQGLSDYVFYKALKFLDVDASKKYLEEAMRTMKLYSRDFFDIIHNNYFVGTCILIVLDSLKIRFNSYDLKQRTIFESLKGKVEFIDEMISYVPTRGLILHIKRYSSEIKETFIDYFAYKTKKVCGKFSIVKFDPYGMLKHENQIYHKQFVGLKSESGEEIMVKGPVITRVDDEYNVICYFERIDNNDNDY